MIKFSLKKQTVRHKKTNRSSKTKRSRKTNRCSKTKRSRKTNRCSKTKRSRNKKQRGGTLEPFTEADFGTYVYDEYILVDPEEYNQVDEGYEPDTNEPTLEYKGTDYPIYTDIDGEDYYIMINDDQDEPIMLKTSAVYREKYKHI